MQGPRVWEHKTVIFWDWCLRKDQKKAPQATVARAILACCVCGDSMSWALGFCRGYRIGRAGSLPYTCFSLLSLVLDGMLYSGTMNNFLGSEPILMRTLGSQPVLKTDIFLRWLHRKALIPVSMNLGPLPAPGSANGFNSLSSLWENESKKYIQLAGVMHDFNSNIWEAEAAAGGS